MATHSSNVTLRAKWLHGWALVHAGKTTEAYDLLSGIKVSDLRRVGILIGQIKSYPACNRSSSDRPIVKRTRTAA